MPDDIETRAPKMCVEVIADRSLHLRKGPSADDIVIGLACASKASKDMREVFTLRKRSVIDGCEDG
jgi:hypothetical protein